MPNLNSMKMAEHCIWHVLIVETNHTYCRMCHNFALQLLQEGLITDDEGEAVFLGFDTYDDGEMILGFESDNDEDGSEYSVRWIFIFL